MAEFKLGGDVKAALALAALLTVAGVLIGDATLGFVITPVVFLIVLYAMTRVPIRYSLMALTFLALIVENPVDDTGCGMWKTPFRIVGALLLDHLNTIDRSALSFMTFSFMELCLACLLFIALYRRSARSKLDSAGRTTTPKPLVQLAYLSLAGTLFVWLSGLLRGGEFRWSLWQVNAVLYLPITFFLFHIGLRGPKDHAALAKVLLSAATYRAILAIYIQHAYVLPAPNPETGSTRLPYATSHHDSMLFAGAFVLLLSLLIERAGQSARRLAFVLLPILAWGMISNNRRMVWVQVASVMLVVYVITPDNPIKKKLRRAMMVAVPIVALYLLVGWDRKYGTLWGPVQIMRSVVDAKSDGSSFWRELENYDLITTLKSNPILGVGYGNPYDEVVVLPKIDYDLERYLPHNSILGLWCYCGYIGFTTTTLLWAGGVYFGVRALHGARKPQDRAAALVSVGTVLIYMVQCWGDMGLASWTGVLLVAPSLAVAGKLAAATGVWGSKKAPKAAPENTRVAPGMATAAQ